MLGVGDDAALLRLPDGADLVAAIDTIVEGRHFPAGSDARSIGHRALAVNLSDLAAMGATPAWATLALTLPSADARWLARILARAARARADAHGVALVGGDTTAGPLTISVQLLGIVPRGTALRRGGARAGDLLAVTGTLGDAGAGLALSRRRRRPQRRAADAGAHAAVRISGAARANSASRRAASPAPRWTCPTAWPAICPSSARRSGVAAHVVDVERLPLSAALRAAVRSPRQARAWALGAGDDYELLLARAARNGMTELAALAAAIELKT